MTSLNRLLRRIPFTAVAVLSTASMIVIPGLLGVLGEPSLWMRPLINFVVLPAYVPRLVLSLLVPAGALPDLALLFWVLPLLPFVLLDTIRALLHSHAERRWRAIRASARAACGR